MTFDEYQQKALTTAIRVDHDMLNLSHWALGIMGEGGEIAEKVKKLIRDKDAQLDEESKQLLAKEIGDVLWYLAVMADQLGVSFDDIAQTNITKLADRKRRSVLGGSGDMR